ncbi:MAG: S8 family peptidase [Sphingomonadales bacterium]
MAGSHAAIAADNLAEWSLINLTPDIVASAGGGAGVFVALYDGKTDCRHPDLTGRCINIAIQGGRYRFYDSHGTHTAGIIAGKKYGVATSAYIINYGVFDDRGYVATGSKLLNAWYNAQSRGATIASMSFGCSKLALCFSAAEVGAMADPNLKMLFVKAAGNDGTNLVNESIAVTQAQADAALARTILVGSVNLSATISSFSNRPGDTCLLYSGATGCSADTQWKNYFIVAPGENIYSTLPNGRYGYMSGTSMATPIVAGAAALLEARWPTLKSSPETVAQILFTTATDLGAPGVDPVYGWGLLNVGRAFQANGTITLVTPSGTSFAMTGTNLTGGSMMGPLAAALGGVTVYDRFGRDFAMAETNALRVSRSYDAGLAMPARRLLGLGDQSNWAGSFFANRYAPRSFAMFNSAGSPDATAFTPDRSLRMGIDMPFKGGVAQVRLTGATGTQLDFAYDPTLRPLSFFASTGLMKNSLFAHALVNVSDHARLSVYGTSSTTGSLSAADPDEPYFLRDTDSRSMSRLALTGTPADHHQSGFGVGYWLQPDRNTVLGFNASMLSQTGGYYDLASNLPAFSKPTRMLNLGVAASRSFGPWEASLSGELTHLGATATFDTIRLTQSNVASGELRLRKNGLAFSRGGFNDSLSLAFVVPPRAVSGSLRADFLTRTPDGLGRQAAAYRYPLSSVADPVRVEAAYQIGEGRSWSFDVSGGLNLRRSDYSGAGEALTSFHLSL